jgi:hypothetical protein
VLVTRRSARAPFSISTNIPFTSNINSSTASIDPRGSIAKAVQCFWASRSLSLACPRTIEKAVSHSKFGCKHVAGELACFSAVSELYQKAICCINLGCPSSEEQIPQAYEKAEKRRHGMEALERETTRPRQVRYQAALRPDSIHSTTLAPAAKPVFDTDAPAYALKLHQNQSK